MSQRDDDFERRLRAMATEADPPPSLVYEAARAAFSLRDLDAELAELVADSLVDDPAVLTRAVVSDVRMLSFECGDVVVELDVETDPLSRLVRLSGLAVGAVGAVTIVRADDRSSVDLADGGRFVADGISPGPLRLELTTPDGRRVTTSWIHV
ncbi:MAG TPA: hypothetical protein VFL59_14820 [Candidatus Nanopelagicales bacterium]|nr:hypothetical protein [Candidatus Nanopelagicales bacterium]